MLHFKETQEHVTLFHFLMESSWAIYRQLMVRLYMQLFRKLASTFFRRKTSIEALACDGTNTNVGAEGGINHLIEVSIGRALQWNVCLLHANELPLRHLIIELDGPTTGANTVGNKKDINGQPRKISETGIKEGF